MTEEQLQADMALWRQRGHSEEMVQKWARNLRADGGTFRQVASRGTAFYNKIRGAAPDTPIASEPEVIQVAPCEVCGGARFVLDTAGNLKPCGHCGAADDIARSRAQSVAKFSSLSGRAAGQTFGNFKLWGNAEARKSLMECRMAAATFADAPMGWVIIWGAPGNGKSHLAAAVYNSLRSRNEPAIYISAPDLLNSLKRLMDDEVAKAENTSYAQRLDVYKTAPVLILDDLGAEHGREWRDAMWFELFDWRYRNHLATFVTMNVNPHGEELAFRLRSRMLDTHDGFCLVYHNAAGDHRLGELEL